MSQDVFSRQIAVPPLPGKARYDGGPATESPSRVPPADEASLAGLEYPDRQRLLKERSEAAGIDRGHAKVCGVACQILTYQIGVRGQFRQTNVHVGLCIG